MEATNQNTNISSDMFCSSTDIRGIILATPRLVTIVVNVLFLYIIYRVYSARNPVSRRQSCILANIAGVHILNATVLLVVSLIAQQIYMSNGACSQVKTALVFVTSTSVTCNFINYILLYSNRYISCLFPLRYELVLTKRKVSIAFILNWMVSLTSGVLGILGILGILGNYDLLRESFQSMPDSVVYLPVATYFLCIVTVLGMNIHMWLMGYIAFRKERAITVTVQQQGHSSTIAVLKQNHPALIRQNHLKTAFISSVLTIKNLVFLFPLVLSGLIQMNGHHLKHQIQLNMITQILHLNSPIFDPFICIFVVKEARAYFLSMMKPCLDIFQCIPRRGNARDSVIAVINRNTGQQVDKSEVETKL